MGLSEDAWLRYRYAGPYGVWAAVLRGLGLTAPDGFTLPPKSKGRDLAALLNDALGIECPPFVNKTTTSPETAWLKRFKGWKHIPLRALPSDRRAPRKLKEAKLLREIFFSTGSVRTRVIEKMKMASYRGLDHSKLAGQLAKECANRRGVREFSLFCDAAIKAIGVLSSEGKKKERPDQRVSYSDVTSQSAVTEALDGLAEAASRWSRGTAAADKDYSLVTDLARRVATNSRTKRVRALLEHHEKHHEGRIWLANAGSSHFRVIGDSGDASQYTYRLWSLALLGVQAGCLKKGELPTALFEEGSGEDSDE